MSKMQIIGSVKNSFQKLLDSISNELSIKLDADLVNKIELSLLDSDTSHQVTTKIIKNIVLKNGNKSLTDREIRIVVANEIHEIIKHAKASIDIDQNKIPHVILMCGVNGSGKTTTVAKMTRLLENADWKVCIAAADTFRHASTEQLENLISKDTMLVKKYKDKEPPFLVAKRAYDLCIKENYDVLLIDTSGRFHNNPALMGEIKKTYDTLHNNNKLTPNNVILNIDAVTGQTNHDIISKFSEEVKVDGLIISKVDLTKAGIIISILNSYKLPVYAIGHGEGISDLTQFRPDEFVKSFVGL